MKLIVFSLLLVCALECKADRSIHGVRLRAGATPSQGRVEVLRGTQWGGVCDDGWGMAEAGVVCRELGFFGAKEALTNSAYGAARGPIWIKSVHCTGEERELTLCEYIEISKHVMFYEQVDELNECSTSNLAGVVCDAGFNMDAHTIELGEPLPLSRESRLLLTYHGGEWLPVCPNTWKTKHTVVACKQLGLFANLTMMTKIGHADMHGNRIKRYRKAIQRIRCKGAEKSLRECKIFANETDCDRTYVAITCSKFAPDISVNITELQSTIAISRLEEKDIICAKSERCLSPSGMKKSHRDLKRSNFRRKLLVFSSVVQNFGTADFIPPPREGGWYWHACHKHYHSIGGFASYQLKSTEDEKVVVTGHKVSFCLEDSQCVDPSKKKYICGDSDKHEETQGISAGCADHYTYNLDCQWIDVTDVHDGTYYLDIVSNPNMRVPELDYSNNYIRCHVFLYGNVSVGWNCHHPADFDFTSSASVFGESSNNKDSMMYELEYLYGMV